MSLAHLEMKKKNDIVHSCCRCHSAAAAQQCLTSISAWRIVVHNLLVPFDLDAGLRFVRSRGIYWAPNTAVKYQCCCKSVPLAGVKRSREIRVIRTYENRSEMNECSTYEIHGVLELGKAIGHSDFGSVRCARANINEKNMQKWIFVPMLHWQTKQMLSICSWYI